MNITSEQFDPIRTPDDLRKEKLLVIDDDIKLAHSLRELLVMEGYLADVCHQGPDGLAMLAAQTYDLVLLDLVMPVMNGHEVHYHIRQQYPECPVIMMSGTGTVSEAVKALRNGAYDFIRKPYETGEMLRTIENALQHARLAALNQHIHDKLEESENLYHYLVDSSPDIIYTLDTEGRFTFVNQRVTTLLGFSREELIGQHYEKLVHEEDLDRARYAFNERRTGDRASKNIELRLHCKSPDEPAKHFETNFITIALNAKGLYPGERKANSPCLGSYGVARDISERKKHEETIIHQAHHDMLTGLPNRALFMDRLGMSIAQAKRRQSKLGVIFLDLDRFKWVNDTLGHLHGDELLKIVAHRLTQCLRGADTLVRLGGDEFTVILPEIHDEEDASLVAQKILAELQKPFHLDHHEVSISASIGIAMFPEHGESIETLIKSADIAMYHVKWQGKNGYRYFDPSMNVIFNQKLSMENDLRKAIEQGELSLHFQPQVHLESRSITGAEALARWRHPRLGWVSPAEFIPLAEETGLIVPLSVWLIERAMMACVEWRRAGHTAVRLAVNISARLVEEKNFVDLIMHALHQAGLQPQALELEITENLLINDLENAVVKLRELNAKGVQIAIDDFGTGYSSLAYLQKFPINCIKIDKSFVQDIRSIHQEVPLINAVAAIASGFHMDIVAEGVENTDQMQVLRSLGCNTMQGFLFSKPLPANELHATLKNPQALFNEINTLSQCLPLSSHLAN